MRQPESRTAAAGPEAALDSAAHRPSMTAALDTLLGVLDRASDELITAVPFLGDQSTGAVVNGYVDEKAAALQELRAETDDLRRVLAIAASQHGGATTR